MSKDAAERVNNTSMMVDDPEVEKSKSKWEGVFYFNVLKKKYSLRATYVAKVVAITRSNPSLRVYKKIIN